MHKNRIQHVKPKLLGLAAFLDTIWEGDMEEFLEQVESEVQEEDYENDIPMVSAYIISFLQFIARQPSAKGTPIPQISQNLIDMIAYINAACASEEISSRDFSFTRGSDENFWKLAQRADKVGQYIKNCDTQEDLNEVSKEVQLLKEDIDTVKETLGYNKHAGKLDESVYDVLVNRLKGISSNIDKSIQDKTKELNQQPKEDKPLFSSKLTF